MQSTRSIALTRDCEATQIPAGTAVVLPAGTEVDITQSLGGTYTISAMGSLYRVSAKEADAFGEAPAPAPSEASRR